MNIESALTPEWRNTFLRRTETSKSQQTIMEEWLKTKVFYT